MVKNVIDDIEEDTTVASDEQLRTISGLLAMVPVMEKQIADKQLELTTLNQALQKLTDVDLPEALGAAGFSAPTKTMINGMKIEFNTFVQTSITEANQPKAFDWLRSNGHGDLIKREIKFAFPKGSNKFCTAFMAAYEKMAKKAKLQIKVADKESVHSGTLKAFVKEELGEGREVPTDIFSIYVGKHVNVKPAAVAPAL